MTLNRLSVYDLTIVPAGEENLFQITWRDAETTTPLSFTKSLTDAEERLLTHWENASNQMIIGETLFRFLDGDDTLRYLSRQLEKTATAGMKIQINLLACKETADWPFELIAANGTFLLFDTVHLVRRVADRGSDSKPPSANDKIRLLFMATDYVGKDSNLNYAREEEAVKKICTAYPIEMDVIDSGTLQGLQDRLEKKYYYIVHVTGHAGIGAENTPIFYMKDITGKSQTVKPETFWEGALIENPPRLLFLSGCRTGQNKNIEMTRDIESFATLMVDKYKIPVVLGWGRNVDDKLAVSCAEAIYNVIGQGGSILEAVQLARKKMAAKWEEIAKDSGAYIAPAWPMLRVYCNGIPFHSILKRVQTEKTAFSGESAIYLLNSRIKILKEGFIGRRTQLQIAMDALKESNYNSIGVLLLGTAGLGKSCLAGKICERFPDHFPIVITGKLNKTSLLKVFQQVFTETQDEIGLKKLAGNRRVMDILAELCTSRFLERHYLLVLDGFEQNLIKPGIARQGDLAEEAAELLNTLFYYLPLCGKVSKLIITSRYPFSLSGKGSRNFENQLQKVWLTGLNKTEVQRKMMELTNIVHYGVFRQKELIIATGSGNPLLMEEIDRLVGRITTEDTAGLQAEIERTRQDFIREIGIDELYRQSSGLLKEFLEGFIIYTNPVVADQIPHIAQKAGINEWQSLLQEAMDLGLVEHDQAVGTYVLSPLVKGIMALK